VDNDWEKCLILKNLGFGIITVQENAMILASDETANTLLAGSPDKNITGNFFTSYMDKTVRDTIRERIGHLIKKNKAPEKIITKILTTPEKWIRGHYFTAGQEKMIIVLEDYTDEYFETKWVEFLAYNDNLTGLPNMFGFEQTLTDSITRTQKSGNFLVIVLVDISSVNDFNESFGQKTGDQIILHVAKFLKVFMDTRGFIARWTSDKFILLFPDIAGENHIPALVQDLHSLNNQLFTVDSMKIRIQFTAGYSVFPTDTDDQEELLALSNRALLFAKDNFKNHIFPYNKLPDLIRNNTDIIIRNSLSNAIANGEIYAVFQPKVSTIDFSLHGMESLVRWNHPEMGNIPPSQFIPIAESTGMIIEIGNFMMESSFALAREMGNPEIKISVNISQAQFFNENFLDTIDQNLAKYQIQPRQIMLEITESLSMADKKLTIESTNRLREKGFHISIDDFGTGYSSLSQLHNLPVDELKIDTSFIRRIHTPDGYQIIHAIASMASAMNLRTVAEGVEDISTVSKLADLKIDELQGYFFSKPLPRTEILEYITNYNPDFFRQEYQKEALVSGSSSVKDE